MERNPNMLIVAFLVPVECTASDILNFSIVKALFPANVPRVYSSRWLSPFESLEPIHTHTHIYIYILGVSLVWLFNSSLSLQCIRNLCELQISDLRSSRSFVSSGSPRLPARSQFYLTAMYSASFREDCRLLELLGHWNLQIHLNFFEFIPWLTKRRRSILQIRK